MGALLASLVDWSRRNAVTVTLLLLALSVAGTYFTATHISIDSNTDHLISPDLPWRQRDAEMDRAFPQDVDLIAIVIDAKTPDLAEDAADALAQRLKEMPQLFRTVRVPEGGLFFRQEGMLFLDKKDVQKFSDQIIAAQPLIGTIAADPSLRGIFGALDLLAQGVIHGDMTPEGVTDPLSQMSRSVEAALQGRYAPLSWASLLSGRTPEPGELRRFVLIQPVLDYSVMEPGARASDAVRDAARALGFTPDRGVRVRLTGPVAFDDDQLATLSKGAGATTALSLGLLCLWLGLALRSLRLVVAIITTLLVGLVACGSFAVGVVGVLNPISIAFAVLFIGLAIDFSIQFSVRYRDERFRASDFATALKRAASGIGSPIAVAAAATAAGFFSFVPTDYVGVSDLGLIAGVGMLIAFTANMVLLPALLTLLRPKGEPRAVGFGWLAPWNERLIRWRRSVLLIALAVAAGAALLLPSLRFDFNPLDLQNPDTEAMRVLNELKNDPNETPYTAEVLTPSIENAVALANRLDVLPEVAQTITAASFIPENQDAKLAILRDTATLLGITLSPPTVKLPPSDAEILAAAASTVQHLEEAGAHGVPAATELARLLKEVAAKGPAVLPALKANLVAGVERRIEDLRLALQAKPVTLASLPDEIKRDWITPDGRARVEIFPKQAAPDNEELRRFVDAVRRVAPDATGTPVTIQESANTVTHAFAVAGMIAVAAIAALLLIVLRSVMGMLYVLAPLALAGLLTLATDAVVGMNLNYANIIALPLLLGVGVAFDVYFVMRWRLGSGDLLQSSTARAILFSALTTGTAFGSLAISNNPGMAEMGKLLSLALAYTLLCTFIVLPALLGRPRPEPGARQD
jgi:uncharacterized protein